jgi:hypothetical protein
MRARCSAVKPVEVLGAEPVLSPVPFEEIPVLGCVTTAVTAGAGGLGVVGFTCGVGSGSAALGGAPSPDGVAVSSSWGVSEPGGAAAGWSPLSFRNLLSRSLRVCFLPVAFRPSRSQWTTSSFLSIRSSPSILNILSPRRPANVPRSSTEERRIAGGPKPVYDPEVGPAAAIALSRVMGV